MSARTIIRTVVTPRTVTRRVGPAGADAEGGGVSSFTDLTDKASADLPAINLPLATALGALSAQLSGKAPATGISPAAISGTAVITTDPRLSDARTPTAHTHPASEISDATATGRSILTAANQAAARSAGLGSGATGDALFTAATPAAARTTLEILTSTVPTDSTAAVGAGWVATGASVALTTGTWRVQAYWHGSNVSASASNVRLAASANWTDTNGRRIATFTGSAAVAGLTYVTGGTSSAANFGTGGQLAGELIAIVKMTGSGTLSMEMTNTAATGTVTCFAGSHIIATKL